jgi:hypothetical protein
MGIFLPEGTGQGQVQSGVSEITPANPETTTEDIALMQRVLSAASRNPNLIPTDFMAYLIDYVQTSRLSIPIGQVFGWQRVSTQIITDFAQIPSPVDGQTVLLKCGSSPFVFIQMIYDAASQHWYSPEFSMGGTTPSISTSQTTPQIITQGQSNGTSFSGISYAPAASTSGLTLQLRWAGAINGSGNHILGHAGIYLQFLKSGSTAIATMSDVTGFEDTTTYVATAFANVSNPGAFDIVNVGIYGYTDAGGNMGINQAAVLGRWIK